MRTFGNAAKQHAGHVVDAVSAPMKMNPTQYFNAVALAGPVLLFPFSRSYYFFYVVLLVLALRKGALKDFLTQARPIMLAFWAFALPVLLTELHVVVAAKGGFEWLRTMGVFLLALMLGMATQRIASDVSIRKLALLLMSVAIISWFVDGALQMLSGHSIACRYEGEACDQGHRLSLYFSHRTKLSYAMGMMALVPACWLIARRRTWWAVGVLMLAGMVEMAAGSRFGMTAYLLGVIVLAIVMAMQLSWRYRILLLLGLPLLAMVTSLCLFSVNASFHERVMHTAVIFSGANYHDLNEALTYRPDIWVPTIHMLADHWLFGVGPGELNTAIRPYMQPDNFFIINNIDVSHAHQVVLDIWAATGVIGLVAFLAFYGWVGRYFLLLSRRPVDAGWAFMLIFLVMWFPFNTPSGFYSSDMVFLTFFVLGVAFGWGSLAPVDEPDTNFQ